MTKELLEKRLVELNQKVAQLLNEYHITLGAKMEVEATLNSMQVAEPLVGEVIEA